MKTIKIMAIMLMSVSIATAQTPESKTSFYAGLTFVPQASIEPTHTEKGFKPFFNLFPQITVSRGNFFMVGFYSIVSNGPGLAVGYKPTDKITTYVVGTKSSMISSNYLGVGIGTPLANKKATGFIELGLNNSKPEPMIYIGMFIPFDVKLK